MSTQTTALILSNIGTIAYFAAHNRQPETLSAQQKTVWLHTKRFLFFRLPKRGRDAWAA